MQHKRLFAVAVLSLWIISTLSHTAHGIDYLQAPKTQFSVVPAPWSLSWQLATPGGQHVDLTVNGLIPNAGNNQFLEITSANAAQFGVDFPAWQAAINDPTFSRSILTYMGMSKEMTPVRSGSHIDLHHFGLLLDHSWPIVPGEPIFFSVAALEQLIVPEPSLALIGIAIAGCHLCSRP